MLMKETENEILPSLANQNYVPMGAWINCGALSEFKGSLQIINKNLNERESPMQ